MTGDTIKQTLSMRDVALRYGFEPNRAGFSHCPFHEDHTASLKIYDEPGRGFHCFGCGKGGSVIDFVMRLFRLDFKQAVIKISLDFGITSNQQDDSIDILRREQKQAKQQQINIIKNKLLDLSVIHCTLFNTIKNEPVWSDDWCKAINNIDYIAHRIEVLECKMIQT